MQKSPLFLVMIDTPRPGVLVEKDNNRSVSLTSWSASTTTTNGMIRPAMPSFIFKLRT